MPFYHQLGKVPSKRHIQFRKPDGDSLYREELVSSLGFSGDYSNKYHIHEPTRVTAVREIPPFESAESIVWKDAPVQHLHFGTDKKKAGNFFSARRAYLYNQDCVMSVAHPSENTDQFFRNLYAHELILVHHGRGELLSEYGRLPFEPWDQLVIPKGTTFQLRFENPSESKILVVESTTAYEIPKHYRSATGQLLEDAPYCERDLKRPQFMEARDEKGEFHVILRAKDRFFDYTFDHHPFDVVGWDGCLYPYAFNMKDFCPKVGRVHLPPPVHLVFNTRSFVVCNFCPRPFDFHEEAIGVPYYHYNIDSDEVLYYVDGDFMSRTGVGSGSVTLHPTGLTHGPQPGRIEGSLGKKDTYEYAFMVDTFSPFQISRNVKEEMHADYYRSWIPTKP